MTQCSRQCKTLAYRIDGTELAVREMLQQLREDLRALGLDLEAQTSVELVLGEVLNNVVEHAYGDGWQGGVEVLAVKCSSELRFRINDHGAPLPFKSLRQAKLPNLNCETHDLPEGGFGWFLVRTIASDLAYRRTAGKNELALTLPI